MILPNRCCCNNCHVAPPDADQFENITKVEDYAASPDPAGIAPYARPWNEISGGACILASVEPSTCGAAGDKVCYNVGFDRVPLTTFDGLSGVKGCNAGPGEIVSQIIDNCYRKTGSKVSFADPCKRVGWKGVQAYALWPGRFGFINSACCTTGGLEAFKYQSIRVRFTSDYSSSLVSHGAPEDPVLIESSTRNIVLDQTASVSGFGNVSRSGTSSYGETASWEGRETPDGGFTITGCLSHPVFNGDVDGSHFVGLTDEEIALMSVSVSCGAVSITGVGADPIGDLDAADWATFIANLNTHYCCGYEIGTEPVEGAACGSEGSSYVYDHLEFIITRSEEPAPERRVGGGPRHIGQHTGQTVLANRGPR